MVQQGNKKINPRKKNAVSKIYFDNSKKIHLKSPT